MRIVFMGTPSFAVPALKMLLQEHEVVLVVTQPDKPAGRKKKLTAPPVKEVAIAKGLALLQAGSARSPEFLQAIQEAKADVAIVVAYGKILPKSVLDAFPLGCLNIHGSLLPKYRGAAPIQRAVLDGEKETGVSIMLLDEGMDTGPIFLQEKIAIGLDDTSASLFEKLAPLGARVLLQVLKGIDDGSLKAVQQDEKGASHAAMLKKGDGLVDWNLKANQVSALIRGMDPWPGAFTPMLDGDSSKGNLKLFGAVELGDNGEHETGAAGTILSYDKEGMNITCGQGTVCVREVQAPGKKRMPAAVFARGRRLKIGSLLSPKV